MNPIDLSQAPDIHTDPVLHDAPEPEPPPVETCAGCGETYAPSMEATEHANCVRAWNRSQDACKKSLEEMRTRVATTSGQIVDIEERLEKTNEKLDRAERELAVRRMKDLPPSDPKEEGLQRAAIEALEHFFHALSDVRSGLKNGYAPSKGAAMELIESASAVTFLDSRARPVVDDLMPAIEAFFELRDLGWISQRSYDDDVESFIALAIVHRCVGVTTNPKPKK